MSTVMACLFKGCHWELIVPSVAEYGEQFTEQMELVLSERVLTRLHGAAIEDALREHLVGEHRPLIEQLAKTMAITDRKAGAQA